MKPEAASPIHEKPLILASRSPRRAALLRELGLPFEVFPSEADERLAEGERPDVLAMNAARLKAEDVARRFPGRLVLGADTIVYLEAEAQGEAGNAASGGTARRGAACCAPMGFTILGKPADLAEARAMLHTLRGRWHGVVTGLCLVGADNSVATAAETTRVRMADFSDGDLECYVAGGEPLDKAGAYGIQGGAAELIEGIEGDYYNVVGLPLELLVRLLSRWMAVDPLTLPQTPERFSKSPARQ
jgi:septum formation protein